MSTELLSIVQYQKKIKNVSRQSILKAAQKNRLDLLPKVIKAMKIGRNYVLEIAI